MGYGVPNPRAGPDDKGSAVAKLMNMCCTFFICCTISMIAFSIMLAVTLTMDSILREEVQELKDDFKKKTPIYEAELNSKVDGDKVALELGELHKALVYQKRGLQNDVNAVGRQIDAAQREEVEPDINCMIESIDHEYTPEVKPCCALLAKEVTAATDMKHYEHCMELLMRVRHGLSGDQTNGLTITSRSDGSSISYEDAIAGQPQHKRCIVRPYPTALMRVCCLYLDCDNWASHKIQRVCKDCRPICPPCITKRPL